jgi:hypothetical protein
MLPKYHEKNKLNVPRLGFEFSFTDRSPRQIKSKKYLSQKVSPSGVNLVTTPIFLDN